MNKAKAAVYCGVEKPFEVTEFEVLEPSAGSARLELVASGVCGTDIHIHTGRLATEPPKIIGHEFLGRITAISAEDSEKSGLKIGDLAVVDIAQPCGKCKLCKTGDDANCVNMGVTNGGNPYEAPHFFGGYAEVCFAPVENIIKIPDGVDPIAACVFACPGPTVLHSFRLAKQAGCDFSTAETAVVQGIGPVGCMAVAYFASLNIKNIVALCVGVTPEKEDFVKKLGASEVIDISKVSEEELTKHIMDLSGGLGADVVLEASGSPKAVPTALEILRNRGVYLVPGQYSNHGGIEIQPQLITFKALHIIGSSQYSICDVADYMKFLSNNAELQARIKNLATCYSLSDINTAINDAKAGKNIKTVLIK